MERVPDISCEQEGSADEKRYEVSRAQLQCRRWAPKGGLHRPPPNRATSARAHQEACMADVFANKACYTLCSDSAAMKSEIKVG